MSEQWIKETMELLQDLENQKSSIESKISQLQEEQVDLMERIEVGHELVTAYMEKHNIAQWTSRDIKLDNLAKKSYPQMLITIAQERSGYLRVPDAVDILFKANVGIDESSIQNNIYSALYRMKNQFTKIAPGQYRYINRMKETDEGKSSGIRQTIKELKENNPQMTKKEVLRHLQNINFDFKGKKPINAVNITWVYLGYSKEGKQQSLLR